MSYNGWTNYETWAVALWFDNDYGAYTMWRERAQSLYDDATDDTHAEKLESIAHDLAREMEEFLNENMPEVSGLYADLLTSAIGSADCHEIAKHYTDEI